jgi:hypothetical protein
VSLGHPECVCREFRMGIKSMHCTSGKWVTPEKVEVELEGGD